MIILEHTTERFRLSMVIVPMGDALCVSLYGGDVPHIGATALAIPHPGLRTPEKTDASVSVLCAPGHKEDGLARKIAHAIAVQQNCTVSASCGIHLDNGTREEIVAVLLAADVILAKALKSLEDEKSTNTT